MILIIRDEYCDWRTPTIKAGYWIGEREIRCNNIRVGHLLFKRAFMSKVHLEKNSMGSFFTSWF